MVFVFGAMVGLVGCRNGGGDDGYCDYSYYNGYYDYDYDPYHNGGTNGSYNGDTNGGTNGNGFYWKCTCDNDGRIAPPSNFRITLEYRWIVPDGVWDYIYFIYLEKEEVYVLRWDGDVQVWSHEIYVFCSILAEFKYTATLQMDPPTNFVGDYGTAISISSLGIKEGENLVRVVARRSFWIDGVLTPVRSCSHVILYVDIYENITTKEMN